MTHNNGNGAYIRERLLMYARALNIDCSDGNIEAILASRHSLSDSLALLRRQLAAGVGGDFLAFRLRQGFGANVADFHPPTLDRRPFPSARFGYGVVPDAD